MQKIARDQRDVVTVYNLGSLCGAAEAMVVERRAEAEKRRVTQRAVLQHRATARLRRAVVLARRAGMDQGEVARELSDLSR